MRVKFGAASPRLFVIAPLSPAPRSLKVTIAPPAAPPGLMSNGKSSASCPSMVVDSRSQPVPAPVAVSRYVPGTTLGIVNRPLASAMADAACGAPGDG